MTSQVERQLCPKCKEEKLEIIVNKDWLRDTEEEVVLKECSCGYRTWYFV